MNWIATAFESLKARFESHVTHANQSLTEIGSRVDTLESVTVLGLANRVQALELRLSEVLKAPGP